MADYQSRKVEIFSNINDIPVAPTSSTGGNISHLYNLYNSLIDLLETDINTLQSTSVTDYSTDISNLQTDVGNLQSSVSSNTNNISTNINNITTNLNSIGTLTSNVNTLTTSNNNIQATLGTIQTRLDNAEADINILFNDLGQQVTPLISGTTLYLDLDNGSDTNDGLTDTTPFLTLNKLYSILLGSDLPQILTINIKGTVTEKLNFEFLTTSIKAKGKQNRAKIIITTTNVGDLIFNQSGILIQTNLFFPLFIEFINCNFIANGNSLNIINDRSFFKFSPTCNFDTTASNIDSIFYFENTEVEFLTFGSDLIFSNTNGANLDCAVKLVRAIGKFEKCTINEINTFVIAQDDCLVINSLNSHAVTNVTTQYDLRSNSRIITNRYSIFSEPGIILDGTSNLNNYVVFDKGFSNPPLNGKLLIISNAKKDYYVRFAGWSGFASGLTYESYADNNTLSSQNGKLNKGQDLSIDFNGTNSIDYVLFQIELHDYV